MFKKPNTVPTPDEFFDIAVKECSGSEIKLLGRLIYKQITENKLWHVLATKELAQETSLCEKNVNECIKSLEDNNWIKTRNLEDSEILSLLENKEQVQLTKSGAFPEYRCWWCKGISYVLRQHHYPIPKSEGGTDTIDICGSCHAEFHFLKTLKIYSLTKRMRSSNEKEHDTSS